MSGKEITVPQLVIDLLQTEDGFKRIKQELEEKNLDAAFCIDKDNENTNTLVVVGTHSDEAAELIKSLTTEIKINVDKKHMSVINEVGKISNVQIRICNNDIWIKGFKKDVLSARDQIKKFSGDNFVRRETFCLETKGLTRYILEHHKDGIETTLKQHLVKIAREAYDADKLVLSGTKTGIKEVKKALNGLKDSIFVNVMTVEQPGLQKFFSSGRGNVLVKTVEQEHRCAVEVAEIVSPEAKSPKPVSGLSASDGSASNGSEEDDDITAQAYSATGIPSAMTMKCKNVKLSWKLGNIETESADILVGSTIGQIWKNFQRAGVRKAIQHADNVSVVSQCGSLPCKHVILTTCREWDGGRGAAERELRSIVQKSLRTALKLNSTSIAFPIIGTGGPGFPKNTASRIMISEVINVTSGWRTSSLKDIRFVVFAQDAQLTKAFQQEFTASSSGSQTVRGGGPSHLQVFSGTTRSAFGNVSVHVYQGDIVQEQTDAIVNINSTDMNMQNAGALSKAVAAAAGPSVQNECTNLGQQNSGSAVVTGAGNLMVPNIIHMIPGNADKQHIQSCIEKCLQVADSNGFQSVSMPAFGTGSYGMSDTDSAQATFQALANVCPNLQNLGQVNIVIFQPQMVQTFQQTLQQHAAGSFKQSKPRKAPAATKTTNASGVSKTSGSMDDVVKTIQFRLFGKSKDCVDKAQTTLTKGLTEACKKKTVEDENISKLSERQRQKLKTKAKELDVTIEFEDRIQRIVVRGDPEDVSVISDNIWEEIRERHKKEEKEQAGVLYKTIKWQYELRGKKTYFNQRLNAVIEKAHANNDSRVTVEVQGEKYVIVFAQSTGTGLSTGQTMSVTRTTVGSAAGHGEGIALPKEWSPMPIDNSGKEATVHLVTLLNTSAEYKKVLNLFKSTGGIGYIVNIERIQNPHLYQQYMVRKQKMDKDNPGMNNERQLFHGTAPNSVNDINTTGFNRSYCGMHGTLYGSGVYFATNASYSKKYAQADAATGIRQMYLACALIGRYTQGQNGMIVPPKGYDSVADTIGPDGSIFVVFYDSQC